MAQSFSTVKTAATHIAKNLSEATSRRGFAAVLQGAEALRKNAMAQKPDEEPVPWIPDPVTGYYKPSNAVDEIDVAELRENLLNQNKNRKN